MSIAPTWETPMDCMHSLDGVDVMDGMMHVEVSDYVSE